jgi:hypothetical protein
VLLGEREEGVVAHGSSLGVLTTDVRYGEASGDG